MPNYCSDTQYMIGLTIPTLVSLRNLNVAVPDQVVYREHSITYVRTDFSRVGDGFTSTDWVWDVISLNRLYKLLEFLGGEDYINLYVVTDKRDATFPNPTTSFAIFSATMWKPVLSGEEGVFIVRSPYALQTVKLQFVNMIEIGGYWL